MPVPPTRHDVTAFAGKPAESAREVAPLRGIPKS